MGYSQKIKCFVYIDFESNLGRWQKEFQEYLPQNDQNMNEDVNDEDLALVEQLELSKS